MEIDESFKRPGSVPFKWEIRPGIPKPDHKITTTPMLSSNLRLPPSRIQALSEGSIMRSRSPSPSRSKRHNLFAFSPPPSVSKRHDHLFASSSSSSSSSPQSASKLYGNNRAQRSSKVETVSQGCFAIPRRKDDKKVCSGVGRFALSNSSASFPSSFERLLITAEVELAANGIL